MSTSKPEMESLKSRLKAMWMTGDFGEVAKIIETGAEEFIDRLALKPGERVLDVACGPVIWRSPRLARAQSSPALISPRIYSNRHARVPNPKAWRFSLMKATQRICHMTTHRLTAW